MKRRAICWVLMVLVASTGVVAAHAAQDQEIGRLIEALQDENFRVRFAAAKALGEMGLDAQDAIPALVEALGDEVVYVRYGVTVALGGIGSAAVPALANALQNEDKLVRFHAAAALVMIGPDARDAIPSLTEALRDESEGVRFTSAFVLGKIGPDAHDAVPGLIEVLRGDVDWRVRLRAAWALAEIGPDAMGPDTWDTVLQDAIPPLIEVLENMAAPAIMRQDAAFALGKIGPAAKDAIPALIEAVQDPDAEVRSAAVEALKKIRGESQLNHD
ncbi:MAG: HEAT repeat domain-containing protein [Candidatus Bipolaricaulia bacterium]